jgi:hypothetical protein
MPSLVVCNRRVGRDRGRMKEEVTSPPAVLIETGIFREVIVEDVDPTFVASVNATLVARARIEIVAEARASERGTEGLPYRAKAVHVHTSSDAHSGTQGLGEKIGFGVRIVHPNVAMEGLGDLRQRDDIVWEQMRNEHLGSC